MKTLQIPDKRQTTAIAPIRIEAIQKKSDQILALSNTIRIADTDEFEKAVTFVQEIKVLMDEIDATFDPIIKIQNQAHKRTIEAKRKYANPLQRAESIVKDKMKEYHLSRERQRKAKEAALREEAKNEEKNRRFQHALTASRDGNHQEANAILSSPVITPLIRVESETNHDAVSFRDVWKFEIVDPALIPEQYKTIDEKKIRGIVKALKDKTDIPGVRVFCDKTVATRRKQ